MLIILMSSVCRSYLERCMHAMYGVILQRWPHFEWMQCRVGGEWGGIGWWYDRDGVRGPNWNSMRSCEVKLGHGVSSFGILAKVEEHERLLCNWFYLCFEGCVWPANAAAHMRTVFGTIIGIWLSSIVAEYREEYNMFIIFINIPSIHRSQSERHQILIV